MSLNLPPVPPSTFSLVAELQGNSSFQPKSVIDPTTLEQVCAADKATDGVLDAAQCCEFPAYAEEALCKPPTTTSTTQTSTTVTTTSTSTTLPQNQQQLATPIAGGKINLSFKAGEGTTKFRATNPAIGSMRQELITQIQQNGFATINIKTCIPGSLDGENPPVQQEEQITVTEVKKSGAIVRKDKFNKTNIKLGGNTLIYKGPNEFFPPENSPLTLSIDSNGAGVACTMGTDDELKGAGNKFFVKSSEAPASCSEDVLCPVPTPTEPVDPGSPSGAFVE